MGKKKYHVTIDLSADIYAENEDFAEGFANDIMCEIARDPIYGVQLEPGNTKVEELYDSTTKFVILQCKGNIYKNKFFKMKETFCNALDAISAMRVIAYRTLIDDFYVNADARIVETSSEKYPDAWGYTNNGIQISSKNVILHTFEVWEENDANEFLAK